MHNPECLVAWGTKCCMVVANIFSIITAFFFSLPRKTLTFVKLWNVVLEEDGDQLAHLCEKWSITEIQGWEEYLTNNTKKEG
jgi:hypothetical protein